MTMPSVAPVTIPISSKMMGHRRRDLERCGRSFALAMRLNLLDGGLLDVSPTGPPSLLIFTLGKLPSWRRGTTMRRHRDRWSPCCDAVGIRAHGEKQPKRAADVLSDSCL